MVLCYLIFKNLQNWSHIVIFNGFKETFSDIIKIKSKINVFRFGINLIFLFHMGHIQIGKKMYSEFNSRKVGVNKANLKQIKVREFKIKQTIV